MYLRRRQHALASAACDDYTELEDFARNVGLYKDGECMNACDRGMLQHACLTEKLRLAGLDDVSVTVCPSAALHFLKTAFELHERLSA